MLCAVFALSHAYAATPDATRLECEKASQALGDGAADDARLAAWKGFEPQCRGTGVYEIRLASLHLDRDEFDLARKALQGMPDDMSVRADVARISIDYVEAVSIADRERLRNVERAAERFADAHPASTEVLGILGHSRLLLGDYEQAIAPLTSVIERSGGTLAHHRHLTIAYARAGQYQSALELLDKTYALGKEVTSDEEFMYAAALAYAADGNVDAAKTMLTLIVNKKPHLVNDEKFQQTILKAKELSGGRLK